MAVKAFIRDQDDQQWLVVKGDPAWPYVAALRKRQKIIILPRDTIIRLTLPPIQPIQDYIARLSTGVTITDDPALKDALRRLVILHDCVMTLMCGKMELERDE